MATVLCIIGGLILGIIFAFINSKISKKGINANTTGAVMGVNVFRFLLDIVALVIGFFVSRAFNLPQIPTLIAIAVGLSVGSMIFLYLLSKKVSDGDDSSSIKKVISSAAEAEPQKKAEANAGDFSYSETDSSFNNDDFFSFTETTANAEDVSVSAGEKE